MEAKIQSHLSHFFHLNEELDMAVLNFAEAQEFLGKVGVNPMIDYFDNPRVHEARVVSILLNYISSGVSLHRIWSGLAL